MFMWITREESNILATEKITSVDVRKMIRIVDAPLVRIVTAVFSPGDKDGMGLEWK